MNNLEYIPGDLVEAWIGINTGSLVAEVVGYNPLYQEYILTNWYIEETRGVISITEDRITPISLTPKILKNNGWEYYSSDGNERIYTKEFKDMSIYIGVDKDSKVMYVYNGINDYGCADDYYLRSVGYVHQLQHFLFGLGLNSEMEV